MLAEKTTSLAEQGAFSDILRKKKNTVYHLSEKGKATPEEQNDVAWIHREEIRKDKAQQELYLATTVKDN